jgi:ribosomal protein S18 acetylase RimI-like enzyme
MTRLTTDPIPEAPMPDDLIVRPVLKAEYRKVFSANDEGFQDHWGQVPLTENGIKKFMESPRFNPAIWKVAWDGEEVAGMVLNFVDEKENEEYQRKRGYTEEIVVRRPYRKRGLAKSLLVQSIAMFREMGMEETALGVDTENLNGVLKLYEDMGYQKMKRFTVFRKPLEYSRRMEIKS